MSTAYERMMENAQLIEDVKNNVYKAEFLQGDKFQVVVEHTTSELFTKLLEALETIDGGRDLLYWYDTLSHFDFKKASVADHTDAHKVIEKFLKKYASNKNDDLS